MALQFYLLSVRPQFHFMKPQFYWLAPEEKKITLLKALISHGYLKILFL